MRLSWAGALSAGSPAAARAAARSASSSAPAFSAAAGGRSPRAIAASRLSMRASSTRIRASRLSTLVCCAQIVAGAAVRAVSDRMTQMTRASVTIGPTVPGWGRDARRPAVWQERVLSWVRDGAAAAPWHQDRLGSGGARAPSSRSWPSGVCVVVDENGDVAGGCGAENEEVAGSGDQGLRSNNAQSRWSCAALQPTLCCASTPSLALETARTSRPNRAPATAGRASSSCSAMMRLSDARACILASRLPRGQSTCQVAVVLERSIAGRAEARVCCRRP